VREAHYSTRKKKLQSENWIGFQLRTEKGKPTNLYLNQRPASPRKLKSDPSRSESKGVQMLAPTVSHNSPFRPVPAPKTRLLLIADTADRLKELKAGISTSDFDITTVSSLEELRAICRNYHDLAVLDVNSAQIRPMLSVLRASARHATIPVFADSARLHENPGLAGVLPMYRAMACSRVEMQMLMKLFCHGSQQSETRRTAEDNRLALL
jgi:hypothetical protein